MALNKIVAKPKDLKAGTLEKASTALDSFYNLLGLAGGASKYVAQKQADAAARAAEKLANQQNAMEFLGHKVFELPENPQKQPLRMMDMGGFNEALRKYALMTMGGK